jgi:hypothetical protein
MGLSMKWIGVQLRENVDRYFLCILLINVVVVTYDL